ncbi:MAG: DUF2029 domain-containing protein [Acidobacteria bacterium]|nr:DUF2029 domain-containing protein [Acidobacteriota bacterium]
MFRVLALAGQPWLSDDLYRYRWEARLAQSGGNPYQTRPNDQAAAHLRDSTFHRIPGRDFKAVYGPLTELAMRATLPLAQRATTDPERQTLWFRLPAILGDLAVLALLGLVPGARLIVYAWSPLAISEFWCGGHNDAILLVFLTAVLALAARGRWNLAGAAVGLAAAAKIWPLILMPLTAARRRWLPAAIAPALLLLCALPFWSGVTENIRFASGFFGGWRNNDALYGPVLALTGDIYRAKYTVFGLLALAVAGITRLPHPFSLRLLLVVTALLALSANIHPWYLTWLLPALAVHRVPALLLWTALAPLAYEAVLPHLILGEWNGVSPMRWLIHAPAAAMFVISLAIERVRESRSRPDSTPGR